MERRDGELRRGREGGRAEVEGSERERLGIGGEREESEREK